MATARKLKVTLVLALTVWAAACAAGLFIITAHSAKPGRAAAAPAELASKLRASGRATLVMIAHPSCPCTRASLHELQRVTAGAQTADVVILFAGSSKRDRVGDDLRGIAESIPGVRVVDDPGGVQAKALGAHTSGTALFYDRAGTLRFSGGITASRGHEGDSAGGEQLRALLREDVQATAAATATPVYGCALFAEAQETNKP